MSVGKKLEALRAANGWTQRQAAAKAGISQAEWHAVETERTKRIGLDVARAIVGVSGGKITLEDLAQKRPKKRSLSSRPPPPRTGTDG